MQRLALVGAHLNPDSASVPRVQTAGAPRTTASLLAAERARASCSAEALEEWLEGSQETVRLKRECLELVARDPVLQATMDDFDMSTEERRVLSTQRLLRFSDLVQGRTEQFELFLIRALSTIDASTTIRWFVQKLLWIDTIKNQGTAAQISRWTEGALAYNIVGCFAMTELGHSSALRGLETTATFEPDGHFVINTPTTTGVKFWIGQAGQIATHAIVFANAFSLGKALGVQLFIVQIRDISTGLPLPGIEVGDLGPKYGLEGNDNGYLRFSHVRVPLDQMLARWSRVSPDGSFHAPPLAALAYGSTIAERLTNYYYTDRQVLTACVRFCLVRCQGFEDPEPQIVDYSTHFPRLMPFLASAYIRAGFARAAFGRYQALVHALRSGDEAQYLAGLPEMHALACAVKSFGSWESMDMFELCRRLMGGFGFHAYAGVGSALRNMAVGTTGGGDNHILVQQTAKFLLKHFAAGPAAIPSTATSTMGFLAHASRLNGFTMPWSSGTFSDALKRGPELLDAFRALLLRQLSTVAAHLASAGASQSTAWNRHLQDLCRVTETYYWVNVLALHSSESSDGALSACLQRMWTLVALWRLESSFADLASHSILAPASLVYIREAIHQGSLAVRQDAAVLVDAFGIPDVLLRVPLANGKPGATDSSYDDFLNAVRASRLNQERVWPHWVRMIGPRQTPH